MSKCREAFLSKYKISNIKMDLSEPLNPFHTSWVAWQAAWNARGKVDASICLEVKEYPAGHGGMWEGYGPVKATRSGKECAEAIEQENEK